MQAQWPQDWGLHRSHFLSSNVVAWDEASLAPLLPCRPPEPRAKHSSGTGASKMSGKKTLCRTTVGPLRSRSQLWGILAGGTDAVY